MNLRPFHVPPKYLTRIDTDGGTVVSGERTQSAKLSRFHPHEKLRTLAVSRRKRRSTRSFARATPVFLP
jgi:hypothetical protein